MEKKSNPNVQGQLDFNAPLMSVRRIAGSPIENEKRDSKIDCRSDSSSKPSPPVYRSELKSGPVRNPGTVPFIWEQSPGRPKDEDRVKANHNYPGPRTPRLPPGRALSVKQANIETTEISSNGDAMINTDQRNRNSGNMLRQDSSVYQKGASAKTSARIGDTASSGSNGKSVKPVSNRAYPDTPFNQSGKPGDDLDPEVYDDFSDALETLSLTESCTVGCNVSLVSGMEDQDSRSSSRRIDPQTRNFMIDRFLPAAKAIASESPQQTSRRLPSKDPPRSVSAGRGSRGPSPFHSRTLMIKRESKHKERDDIAALSSKACGLFPWRFKNAFSHLSPRSHSDSTRMKSKKHFSLSPAPNRGNSRGNLSDGEPFSDSDDGERTWEAIYRQKLVYGSQSSGYNDTRGFSLNASPEIKDGVMNRISCGSDSQSSNIFRTPTSGGISPYRNEPFRSPFSEGAGFLGFPKTDKEDTMSYMETRRRSCNSLNDMGTEDLSFWKSPPLLGNSTRSGSVSPVVEKTVYVDSVHKTIPLEVKPGFSKHDELLKGSGSKFDIGIPDSQREPENYVSKTCRVDSMEMLNIGKERNVLKSKNLGQSSSLVVMKPYCSDQPVCVSKDSGCREQSIVSVGTKNIDDIPVKEGWPLGISSKCKEVAAEEKPLLPVNVKPENNGSDMGSPLAPPLPKSPSESWLWRAMPRPSSPVSPSSQYSRFGSPLRKQQQGSKSSITDPKWENIVKSTHKQLSHLRFSEEFNHQASTSSLRDSGS